MEGQEGQMVEEPQSPPDGLDGSGPVLTRQQILDAEDIIQETLAVPEWGGVVYVRGLTGRERDAFEAAIVSTKTRDRKQNLRNVRAKLCVLSLVNQQGQRIFTEADIEILGNKSASALTKVWNVAQRLSGLTDEDVEELALGFDDGQSEPSTSG